MAGVRFAIGMHRLFPAIGYHHLLILVGIFGIVFSSLPIAGSSAHSSLTGVYILSLFYSDLSSPHRVFPPNTNISSVLHGIRASAELEVRIGYFGSCFRKPSGSWLCGSNSEALLTELGPDFDPLNLIWIAKQFQDGVLFSGLTFMAIGLSCICVCLFYSFPSWHNEHDDLTGSDIDVKPFPSRAVVSVIVVLSTIAAMLSLIVALWQHIAAVAAASVISSTGYGSIATRIGAAAVAMSWVSTACFLVVTVGAYTMLHSLQVLDHLLED